MYNKKDFPKKAIYRKNKHNSYNQQQRLILNISENAWKTGTVFLFSVG